MAPTGVPKCDYVPSLGMFRVRKQIGKNFTSGGFGITLGKAATRDDGNHDDSIDNDTIMEEPREEEDASVSVSKPEAAQHLFIEEALVLFERGVLDVYDDSSNKLDARRLYGMLEPLNVPIPIYLTYAHLRSQSYRVLRHVPFEQTRSMPASTTAVERDKEMNDSEREQEKRQNAKVARIANYHRRTAQLKTLDNDPTAIVFDAYLPNTFFRKTNPGRPHFVVSVASYRVPSPTFVELQQLQKSCEGVPVRIATVSDGGAVIMFGMTNVGAPDISARDESDGQSDSQSTDGVES